VEIEPTRSGAALLSWQPSPRAGSYQVWRAEIQPVLVRDELNFENWNGQFGNKIPDTYVGPYEQIAVSREPIFIDSTVETGRRYMYAVVLEAEGQVSDPSNLVTFPPLNPPMTFARLLQEVDRLEGRHRFFPPAGRSARVRKQLLNAQSLAAACRIDDALENLKPRAIARAVRRPDATDLEVLAAKLGRRLQIFQRLPQEVNSDEFCRP
jgi:hypothetical protein